MKKLMTAGIALSLGLALSGVAKADITIASAGPMTGGLAAFGLVAVGVARADLNAGRLQVALGDAQHRIDRRLAHQPKPLPGGRPIQDDPDIGRQPVAKTPRLKRAAPRTE